jgi:hypothetical protein
MLSLGKQPLWLKDAEFALSMVERQQSDVVWAIMFNRADDHILATANGIATSCFIHFGYRCTDARIPIQDSFRCMFLVIVQSAGINLFRLNQ